MASIILVYNPGVKAKRVIFRVQQIYVLKSKISLHCQNRHSRQGRGRLPRRNQSA